ncbi:MAG: hypothetical protein H6585_12815 [Flavobacteriales bacterium]|nr:hypothetical protein [Flavobacteriales bacterium]MCB9449213.1 hypothetical protein [Flavobacteriales bacterium]
MKRRSFVKKTMAATAGAFVAPYILPSGRLFAATGARKVDHVVFCMFAGGVRNLESVHKADGNLMPHMFSGTESISPDIYAGVNPITASPLSQPLQKYGTLFKEFRYAYGPTGHFNGHTTALTGVYSSNDINIRENPKYPTVFEYYRKHNTPSMPATNAWWVSDSLGSYPLLNYSNYPGYGAAFGGNHIQPSSFIMQGYNALANPRTFSASEQSVIEKVRGFCDSNFAAQYQANDAGVTNDPTGASQIDTFINQSFTEAASGLYNDPWGIGGLNGDQFNIFFAEQIIKEFTPELLVVNMQGVDVCHTDFTNYCKNLNRASYATAHLWKTIQSTPGMQDNTVMIVVPEHGRNLDPNTIMDPYGRFALDHTNDDTSREIFCLVVGPPSVVKQDQVISSVTGQSIDVVPTIANVLGFDTDIPAGMLAGTPLSQAFV